MHPAHKLHSYDALPSATHQHPVFHVSTAFPQQHFLPASMSVNGKAQMLQNRYEKNGGKYHFVPVFVQCPFSTKCNRGNKNNCAAILDNRRYR
eukprot:1160804-Pelagomonas_calceolata.AAC.8